MSQALGVEKRSGILEFQGKNGTQTVSVCRNAVWEEERGEKQKEHSSQVGCPDTIRSFAKAQEKITKPFPGCQWSDMLNL